ncbi:MAG: hypothetical protein WC136_10655, partial [Sphaerochaeta sp.]
LTLFFISFSIKTPFVFLYWMNYHHSIHPQIKRIKKKNERKCLKKHFPVSARGSVSSCYCESKSIAEGKGEKIYAYRSILNLFFIAV